MQGIFTVLDHLDPELATRASCAVTGPGGWWQGPLDVEALARSSVGLALAAVETLARTVRGHDLHLTATFDDVAASFGSISHLQIAGCAVKSFAPNSGFFPTADGWVRTHANYPHHAQRLRLALEVSRDDLVAPALHVLTSAEAESRIVRAGGMAAAVATVPEWAAHRAPETGPWISLALRDRLTRRLSRIASNDRPLQGVRVISLTRVVAGPTAAKFLAALGADVHRIDPPQLPELPDSHVDTDLGVRCTTSDLKNARGLEELLELLRSADVLLTGYRPYALDNVGLTEEVLQDTCPHLIHVNLSAWEPHGSRTDQRGFDSIVQAATGIAHLYRTADPVHGWRPGALPVQALDHATGYGMAAAALVLLAQRRAGRADLSLERTARSLLSTTPDGHDVHDIQDFTDTRFDPQCLASMDSAEGEVLYVPVPARVNGTLCTAPGS